MNKEHVKGAEEESKGKIKEGVGHAIGNKNLEDEGKVDQVKGSVHNAMGDAKDAVKDAFNNVKNRRDKR